MCNELFIHAYKKHFQIDFILTIIYILPTKVACLYPNKIQFRTMCNILRIYSDGNLWNLNTIFEVQKKGKRDIYIYTIDGSGNLFRTTNGRR